MEEQKYKGTCHCGNIEFKFSSTLASSFRCNCTFCSRRGAVIQKVTSSLFEIIKGHNLTVSYGSRDFAKHHFCKNCGINTFTIITRDNQNMVGINLACVPDIDINKLDISIFDGANKL